MGVKQALQAHALFVSVLVLIAVAWVGGRALLGRHEGVLSGASRGDERNLVRSAEGVQAREPAPATEALPRGSGAPGAGVWVHGRVGDAHQGYAGALGFRAAGEDEERRTRARADGFYEILLPRPGPYRVAFEPEARDGLPRALLLSRTLTSAPDQELALALPDGRLDGRLATLGGSAVEGASVALFAGPAGEGAPDGEPLATTATDAGGRFAFGLLERGHYHVFARSRSGSRFARAEVELEREEPVGVALAWPD